MNVEEVKSLELKEQESGGSESFGLEDYSKLLAGYMLIDELCDAKFLWKRIPKDLKKSAELEALWTLFKKLWSRDFAGFYSNTFQWSPQISPIVTKLKENVRERNIGLLSRAYISISLPESAGMLGLTTSETEVLCSTKGWKVENGLIYPEEELDLKIPQPLPEEQIKILAQFVTCLEN